MSRNEQLAAARAVARSRPRRGGINTAMEAVCWVAKAPRSAYELSDLLGLANPEGAYRYLNIMREHGLTYIGSYRRNGGSGPPTAIHHIQPIPFELADVPKKAPKKVAT